MAAFNSPDLVELMGHVCRHTTEQTWSKAEISAAFQAIEDLMVQASTRTAVGSAIEGAAPGMFSVQQKELLFAVWSLTYARRQGVI